MSMNQAEAAELKAQIERVAPEVSVELKQYPQGWVAEVRNPRTGESFGVVSPNDWRTRLATIEGWSGGSGASASVEDITGSSGHNASDQRPREGGSS